MKIIYDHKKQKENQRNQLALVVFRNTKISRTSI